MMTIALLMGIAVLRYLIDRRMLAEKRLTERWQPYFFHAVEGLPVAAPRIFGRDREIILLVWIHFTESIRGEARLRLRQLALDLKLDRTARKLLARRSMRARLMAVVALGRLKSEDSWDDLVALGRTPNPTLALLATRSLLQIDPARGVPILLDELIRRDDWPIRKVAAMLAEVPPEALAPPLLRVLHEAALPQVPRLLSLIELAQPGDVWPTLAPLLEAHQPVDILVAALKACRDPRALGAARLFSTHAQWAVRAQAATTLGRLGEAEDRLRLQALLSDPEWWVRYRAALALVNLPSMSRAKLAALCGRLEDRFAADILHHVLAETATGSGA